MTLAAGFNCTDGIYICADTKHVTGGGSQFHQDKIFDLSDNNCQFLIALAGATDYGKMVVDKLEDNLDICTSGPAMEDILKKSVRKVFKENIFCVFGNDRTRPQIEAIAVATFCTNDAKFKPQIWKIVDASVSRIKGFDAVGSGSDIARFYYRWVCTLPLWDFPQPMHVATVLASHILALAHAFDPDVGEGFTARGIPAKGAPTNAEGSRKHFPGISHFSGPPNKEFMGFLLALKSVIMGCSDMECDAEQMKQKLTALSERIMEGKAADAEMIARWSAQVEDSIKKNAANAKRLASRK